MISVESNVLARIDVDFDQHLELAKTFVQQPSISADGTGITEMAALVAEQVEKLGGLAQVVPTDGHPIVYGEVNVGAPRTLLIYGMYDVQPVDDENWRVPPFSGEIVHLPKFGDCMVSRGVMNSKGPLAGTFAALGSIRSAAGELPVNVKFVVEGEEELGSKSLPSFVAAKADSLGADAVLFPFYSQDETGKVVMYLGAKGLLFLELSARGGEWGGPKSRGIHGAYGAWMHNPAWVLTHALATMLSHDQTHVLIEGLYEEVTGPSAEDEDHLSALADSFDPTVPLGEQDVACYKFEESSPDLMRKYLFEPSLNINGMVSGHHGSGSKTLLPREAVAKVDFRLVPDMDPERVVKRLRTHLDQSGFPQVTIESRANYPSSKSSINDFANAALLSSYRKLGFEPEVWPLIPGSAPFYLFTRELGLDLAIGGLGHGGGQHSPNEYATISGMKLFEKSIATFVSALAGSERE